MASQQIRKSDGSTMATMSCTGAPHMPVRARLLRHPTLRPSHPPMNPIQRPRLRQTISLLTLGVEASRRTMMTRSSLFLLRQLRPDGDSVSWLYWLSCTWSETRLYTPFSLTSSTLSGGAVYVLYTRSERVRAMIPTSLPFHISVPTLKSPILPSFASLPSPSKFRQSRRRWRRKGHKGFRPPESRLREWATEEGVLDDNYERGLLADSEYDLGGEEDFMVNARGGSDVLFNGDETDEEMPLTPSPRQFKSGGAKNYGTVG